VTRSGEGAYQVVFNNVAAASSLAGSGGNVQVTAYSPGAYCKVLSWSSSGDDVSANVRCFGYDGTPQDSRYVALFNRNTFEGFADAHGTEAYVWSQSDTYPASTPASATFSTNNSGDANTIKQDGTGDYEVVLPSVDITDASVLVTAYGSGNARCQVKNWSKTGSSVHVSVYCTTPQGAPTNSRFTLSYTGGGVPGRVALGGISGAYAWAEQPLAADYTPTTSYQGNDMRGSLKIERKGVGHYNVAVPHANTTVASDAVLVTAYGATGHQCLVNNWLRVADKTDAVVRCYKGNGDPVDTQFTFSYLTSAPHNP
jgi:hypothetical protein